MTDKTKAGAASPDAASPDAAPQPLAAGEALLAANANSVLVTDLDKILQRQDACAEAQMVLLGNELTADEVAATVLLAPKDLQVIDTKPIAEAMRTKPKRREGTHTAHTLDAFNALTNRFKAANSVIFANQDASTLTAILDFHPQGEDNTDARFAKHRVSYGLPFSKEWKAWQEFDGKPLDQVQFAAFIEDRIADVTMPGPKLLGAIVNPADAGGDFGVRTPQEDLAYLAMTLGGRFATPAELVTLSRGLTIRESLNFKTQENLSTGETTIQFESTHQDGSGAPLQVPNLFLIAIPVYYAGDVYAIAVRLRYRRSGQGLKWFYQMYRVDQGLEHAFTEAATKAAAATELPLYRGAI